MKTNHKLFAAIAAFFLLAGSYSHALAVIKLTPRTALTPSVTIREEYNDNIFLTSSNEVDDFITTVNPAIALSYAASMLTLSLDYGLAFRFYAKHPELNETSLTQAQRAKLDTTISLYQNIFFFKVSDVYERVPIDQRNQVALDNIFVNMTNTNRLQVNPYLEYPLSSTLKTRVGYTYDNIWYKEPAGDDTENHKMDANITKDLSGNISTSLSYSYLMHRPSKTDLYDNQNVSLGVRWSVTPKVSLSGSVGETFFDYESSDRKDTASTVWQAQANYLLSDRITLGAGYSENFADSVNLGTYKNKSATGSVNYKGKIPLNLTVYSTTSKYTSVDREDKSAGVSFNSSIPLAITPRLTGSITGNYSSFTFLPENEKVDRYSVRASFGYDMKITVLSFGYTFNLNDSNKPGRDYINNIMFVEAKFTL